MKQFLIFSIFVYLASVNILSTRALTGKQILIMKECAEQYNADEKKYADGVNAKSFLVAEKNLTEAICILACGIRKNFAKDVTVSDPLKTWYNATTKFIAQASKNGFDKADTRSTWNYTLQEATNSVENCYSTAKNECDFLNCTDFANGPIWAVYVYMKQYPVENPVFIHDE